MELFVYRGEWGLPSIDFECSRILAYLKFSDAKITVNFNGNPFSSTNGMLPYLIADGKKFAGYDRIIEFLSSQKYNANRMLAEQNYILINGHMQYIHENLHPFFMYALWGDPKNIDTTRALYAKRIPIPFNFYCPRKYVLKTNEIVQSLAGFNLEDSIELHDVADLSLNAKKCINWIAERLDGNRWFFGEHPSEIDAMLYGYLSVLSKLTLPNNMLQNHIKHCSNLVKYVDSTTAIYFSKEGFTSAGPKASTSSSSNGHGNASSESAKQREQDQFHTGKQQDGDDSPQERRKRYVLSGLFATVAMLGYAVLHGILTLPMDGGRGDFITYDEPEYDEET